MSLRSSRIVKPSGSLAWRKIRSEKNAQSASITANTTGTAEGPSGCKLPVQWVQHVEESTLASQQISKHASIAVDCEGTRLSRDGKLCLLQIATPDGVYLFDLMHEAGVKGFLDSGGLRSILESESILKVMHDCRNDSDALYHLGGVRLANVFDTQIAFAVYRRQCGSGGPWSSTPLPVGLNTLLKKYGQANNAFKDEARQEMTSNETYWETRPLPQLAMDYAAADVAALLKVHRSINSVLTVRNRKIVATYSKDYTGQYRDDSTYNLADVQASFTIPKYGIEAWDSEIAKAMARRKR
eukprot:Rmarinus@m.1786